MYSTGDCLAEMGHQVDYLFKEKLEINVPDYLNRLIPIRIPRLIEEIEHQKQRYDIVELHEAIAGPYCFMRQFNKHLPPVVVFSHGLERRLQMAELAYFTTKKLSISLSLRWFRLTVAQSMYAIHHADHVICLNSEDVSYLKSRGLPSNRLSQHSNGVESKFLMAGEELSRDNTFRSGVLFLGSWIYRKGILDLVAAMSCVMQQYPSLKLTIAGCGCEEETVLSNFPLMLHSRIQVIPKITSDEKLIEVYRQHSIFVLPSYFEGQPLAMLEAAAMGLAIITTNICGMNDFIDSGVNGLTVSVGDIAGLTEALKSLVSSNVRTQQMGDMARQKVRSYTWFGAAEKIALAYEKVIQENSKITSSGRGFVC